MRKYRVVSVFSGAMGLDLGLDRTGRFELLACVEIEKAFCDTLRANQAAGRLSPGMKIIEADMSVLDPTEVLRLCGLKPGDVDLLVGGPPCQSFSTAGKRGTSQDPRGTLLWDFLRFVEAMRPRFFVMENVRGLLSAALNHRPLARRPNKGGTPLTHDEMPGSVVRLFADDMQKMTDGAYHMDCFEVNAVNYGAPQLRERAIFIGNRYNALVDFPDPTHGCPSTGLKPWATLRNAIGKIERHPNDIVMDFSPRKKGYLSLVPEGSNWRSLPEHVQKASMGKAWHSKGGRSGWWRRLSYDLPCPTLMTMPNHASTALCHPTEVRALSLREYAAIQGFPVNWEICGTPMQQYAQAGNAVPVRLGEIAGAIVASKLDTLAKRRWRPYANTPETYRIVYVQSHVRTRKWFKAGTTYIWDGVGEHNKAASSPSRTLRKSTDIATLSMAL